jgi:hypothetical protein
LNREKGRFIQDEKPKSVSLTRQLWDYIGLDKN